MASAPESNLSLLLKGIREARRSLLVNIYEMKSPEIAEALMAKVREGVSVKILEEGQPVGGLSTEARTLNQKIVKVMRSEGTDCAFFEMTSDAGAERRFRFDHAKYIVIDGKSLLIGSENYSSNSLCFFSKR